MRSRLRLLRSLLLVSWIVISVLRAPALCGKPKEGTHGIAASFYLPVLFELGR